MPLRLAEMHLDVGTSRLLVHAAAPALDAGDLARLPVLVPGAKTRAVDTAISTASACMPVLGATRVTVGGGAEKLLRDAWTGGSYDVTGDLLGLAVAQGLTPPGPGRSRGGGPAARPASFPPGP